MFKLMFKACTVKALPLLEAVAYPYDQNIFLQN